MIHIISFTKNGAMLGDRICGSLSQYAECEHCAKYKNGSEYTLGEWTRERFKKGNVLIFIGACGIAVRAIAPYVESKDKDAAVLVVDERAGYVIPLLSGHMGGANDAARLVAEITGAVPVITTATDINKKFAVDVFASRNGLGLSDLKKAKKVSADILDGMAVDMYAGGGVYFDDSVENGNAADVSAVDVSTNDSNAEGSDKTRDNATDSIAVEGNKIINHKSINRPQEIILHKSDTNVIISDKTLQLYPPTLILGIGCKRGKTAEELESFILSELCRNSLALPSVFCIASIDKKADEAGIIALCEKYGWEFKTFSAKTLMRQEGEFAQSDFVSKAVGADNVCERAAMAAGADELLVRKTCKDGMTLAAGRRKIKLGF